MSRALSHAAHLRASEGYSSRASPRRVVATAGAARPQSPFVRQTFCPALRERNGFLVERAGLGRTPASRLDVRARRPKERIVLELRIGGERSQRLATCVEA